MIKIKNLFNKILLKINNTLNKKKINYFFRILLFLWILFISYSYLKNRGLELLFFILFFSVFFIFISKKYFLKIKIFKKIPENFYRRFSLLKIVLLLYLFLLFLVNTVFLSTVENIFNFSLFLNFYFISSIFFGLLFLIEINLGKNINKKNYFLFSAYFFLLIIFLLFKIPRADLEINIIYRISEFYFFHLLFLVFLISIGKKIIKIFKFNFQFSLEIFFSLGLGFVFLSLFVFFLAILGFLEKRLFILIFSFIFLLLFKEIYSLLKLNQKNIEINFKKQEFFIFVLLISILSLWFVLQIKPNPYDNDSLHAYFNVPVLYINAGHYIPIKNTVHQAMGQNAEMIYLFIIRIFNYSLITPLSSIWIILSFILFYHIFLKIFSKKQILLALLLFFLSPVTIVINSGNKIDNLLLFFIGLIFLSLYYFYLEKKVSFLYLAGIFAGYAVGIKYTALFFLIPFALFTIFSNYKQAKKYLFHYLLAVFLALLIFSPWAIKNFVYYHNPMHPYIFHEENRFPELGNIEKFEKERNSELNLLKLNKDYHKNIISNFFKMIYLQSIKRNADVGFLSLLIIPFLFLIKIKKENLLIVLFAFIIFIPWYLSFWSAPWYVYPVFIFLYLIASDLLIQNTFLFFYVLLIYLSIFFMVLRVPQINLDFLNGKTNVEKGIKISSYWSGVNYINHLNLGKNEKIAIIGDFKLAFIKNNNEIIDFIDPYLMKSGYALNKGDDFFLNFLKKRKIKYIVSSSLMKKYKYWLLDADTRKYLETYQSDIPSIYESISDFQHFLKTKTKKVFGNPEEDYYSLYKIN